MFGVVRPVGRKLDSHRPPPVAVCNQGSATHLANRAGVNRGDASPESEDLPYKIPKGWRASPVSPGDGSPKVWFRRCVSPMLTPYPYCLSPVAQVVPTPPPSPDSVTSSDSTSFSSGELDLVRFLAMSPPAAAAVEQSPPPNSPCDFGASPLASTDSLSLSSHSSEEQVVAKAQRAASAPSSPIGHTTSKSFVPLTDPEKEIR
jgi:hypothetical protein